MSEVKLCKDCKFEKRHCLSYFPFIGPPSFREFSKCAHPNFTTKDLITGNIKITEFCSVLRIFRCGKEAKYFEPKNG